LLAAALLSTMIPFLKIPVNLFWSGQQHPVLVQTLKVINANGWEEPVTIYASRNFWAQWITIQNVLCLVYLAGAVTGCIILARSLAWIRKLQTKYPYEKMGGLTIYNTTEPGTPFSFFRSIFWDQNIALNDAHGQQIFRHELFHVKEKHSTDVLLLEILCCIGWFNPFYHLVRKEIRAIHEFLADEYAASANNRYDYAELLLAHAITQRKLNLTNPFFHNQIKRRITMITQSNLLRRSGYISRIMALPLLFVLVSAFAVKLTGKPVPAKKLYYSNKTITVVIDPGHGGIYEGSHNENGLKEKDINLIIAKKIKEISAQYNLNIILTRTNDASVGNAATLKEDLMNRVTIAGDAKADLFISIHTNASDTKTTDSTGFEAYISGRKQNIKDRQLASTLLTSLQDIYAANNIIRQRETGVVVIDKPACPAVLLECGYITNAKDAAFITNPANQEKIARKILEGIVKYSNSQTVNGTAYLQEQENGDTISAEALSKLDVDAIKSINVDLPNNLVIILLKNGGKKFARAKEVNAYYTANHIDGELKGYKTNVTMKDSVAEVIFTKDTVPGNNKGKNIIFTKVEFEPDYPGGQQGWINYLTSHLHYPDAAVKKNIQGTVVMQFIVNTDGKITDVKAISGPEALKAESIRAIKQSGSWEPAKQNGLKVRAYKKQPIIYKLA